MSQTELELMCKTLGIEPEPNVSRLQQIVDMINKLVEQNNESANFLNCYNQAMGKHLQSKGIEASVHDCDDMESMYKQTGHLFRLMQSSAGLAEQKLQELKKEKEAITDKYNELLLQNSTICQNQERLERAAKEQIVKTALQTEAQNDLKLLELQKRCDDADKKYNDLLVENEFALNKYNEEKRQLQIETEKIRKLYATEQTLLHDAQVQEEKTQALYLESQAMKQDLTLKLNEQIQQNDAILKENEKLRQELEQIAKNPSQQKVQKLQNAEQQILKDAYEQEMLSQSQLKELQNQNKDLSAKLNEQIAINDVVIKEKKQLEDELEKQIKSPQLKIQRLQKAEQGLLRDAYEQEKIQLENQIDFANLKEDLTQKLNEQIALCSSYMNENDELKKLIAKMTPVTKVEKLQKSEQDLLRDMYVQEQESEQKLVELSKEKDDILSKYNEQIIMVDMVMRENDELKKKLADIEDGIISPQQRKIQRLNESEQQLLRDAYEDAAQTNEKCVDLLTMKEDLTQKLNEQILINEQAMKEIDSLKKQLEENCANDFKQECEKKDQEIAELVAKNEQTVQELSSITQQFEEKQKQYEEYAERESLIE